MHIQSPRLKIVSVNQTFFEYFDLSRHGHYLTSFCQALANDLSLDGLGPWLIFLKDSKTIIGEVGVKQRVDASSLEVYLEIFPEYQGEHFGAEAMIAYTQFATSKNIHYLVAHVPTENLAAQRVFERAKFIRQETRNDLTTYRFVNLNWYEKTEDHQ
ncbi:MAG: GNAT family N-acetyltransferase [Culicoidibacterales bacterium]